MSKNRYVDTKFWDDAFIANCDPIEKLLFLYFLTNPLTNISGTYEIMLKRIAFDTGIDRDMVLKILERFEAAEKMKYSSGWIAIKNFIKHQKVNPNIQKGIEDGLKKAPADLVKWIEAKASKDLESLSKPLNYINTNINLNSNLNINTKGPKTNAPTADKRTRSDAEVLAKDDIYNAFILGGMAIDSQMRGREMKALWAIIDRSREYCHDNPFDFARNVVAQFFNIKKNPRKEVRFISDQPALPSALNSNGIWPRVLETMKEAKEKALTDADRVALDEIRKKRRAG